MICVAYQISKIHVQNKYCGQLKKPGVLLLYVANVLIRVWCEWQKFL